MTNVTTARPGFAQLLPGIALCALIGLAALAVEWVESGLAGRAWIEALVLAIIIGTVIRTFWTPGELWTPGIQVSATFLLEVAVVLLGASLSAQALGAAGGPLILGIFGVVTIALITSYGLGRLFGLPRRMAILIACGNSICGNSAIAAVAPVIGADGKDVASSIAFTAVLGVAVVLLLPFLGDGLGLADYAYGAFAGLTVYAVPQVLAATLPVSALAAQTGTLVKLVRVLMLGPVVLVLSIVFSRLRESTDAVPGLEAPERARRRFPPLHMLVPWFIVGFIVLALARSAGAIPQAALQPMSDVATALTILSMAALGLGVDVSAVAKAGPRVMLVVTLSLLILGAVALGLIGLLQIG